MFLITFCHENSLLKKKCISHIINRLPVLFNKMLVNKSIKRIVKKCLYYGK